LNKSWVQDWDDQQAWNLRHGANTKNDSAAVKKIKGQIRKMMAARDDADRLLANLRTLDLPDNALERLVDRDEFPEICRAMAEKGATIMLSDEDRNRWNESIEESDLSGRLRTTRDRIDELNCSDEGLRFWLAMYPQFEVIQRYHVALAEFCDHLQVDPDGEQTMEAFSRWMQACKIELFLDEIEAAINTKN
jgi:hypothetical protein